MVIFNKYINKAFDNAAHTEVKKVTCDYAQPDANSDMTIFYHCNKSTPPKDGHTYVACYCLCSTGELCNNFNFTETK